MVNVDFQLKSEQIVDIQKTRYNFIYRFYLFVCYGQFNQLDNCMVQNGLRGLPKYFINFKDKFS